MTSRRVAVLGATGSVGQSTLDIIRRNPDDFSVSLLSAHSQADALAALVEEFRPERVILSGQDAPHVALTTLEGQGTEIAYGCEALKAAAAEHCDILVAAIVGAAGLAPTLAAVDAGHRIAFANKEALVCAGSMLTQRAQETGAELLPIDSEHNAIFQVFERDRPAGVSRLILTASGGPFRTGPADLSTVTPAMALRHPTWDMGAKISIDSATLMNKGLEVIEAYHLFPVSSEQIDVIIHPQSIIHSMVEYVDGSILAQLGSADMRIPIGYALGYPDRLPGAGAKLDLDKFSQLSFEEPDVQRFPCLRLAMDCMRAGGDAAIRLNAANEIAVSAFLDQQIRFMDIPAIVGACLDQADTKAPQSLEMILSIDRSARTAARDLVARVA